MTIRGWITLAGVAGVLGTVPLLVGLDQANHADMPYRDNFLVQIGSLFLVLAFVAMWWGVTLYLAHGHHARHVARDDQGQSPKPPSDSPPSRPPFIQGGARLKAKIRNTDTTGFGGTDSGDDSDIDIDNWHAK